MAGTFDESQFRSQLDSLSIKEIRKNISDGMYAEPAKSIAVEVLALKSSERQDKRESSGFYIQAFQLGAALLALLVAIAAYFKQ